MLVFVSELIVSMQPYRIGNTINNFLNDVVLIRQFCSILPSGLLNIAGDTFDYFQCQFCINTTCFT